MLLPEPWPRSQIVLRERTLSVRTSAGSPDAPPAVFVHGLGGTSLNWTDLMALMAPEVRGYAVDLHGFGQSPPPRDGDVSPRGHARAVADFIVEELGGEPVHLFGNSLGGAVALQLAARRPELVRTLTLVSPALPNLYATPGTVPLTLMAVPGVGESLMRRYREKVPVEQRVRNTIQAVMVNPDRTPEQRLLEAIEEQQAREHLPYADDEFLRSLRALLATFLDRGPERPWKLAERVECPVLVVYGLRDPLIDPKSAHRATKHFRNAEVLVLPDGGHVAQIEDPLVIHSTWQRACRDRIAT